VIGVTTATTSSAEFSRRAQHLRTTPNSSLTPKADGSYLIDRDGRYFIYVLNFLSPGIANIFCDRETQRMFSAQ
jgi:hypothetical protein